VREDKRGYKSRMGVVSVVIEGRATRTLHSSWGGTCDRDSRIDQIIPDQGNWSSQADSR
jgi:hypothetical protein